MNVLAELGHGDLIDPDGDQGPDESVDADLAWGPGIHAGDAPVRPWLQPPPPVVGTAAADVAQAFFARQRASRAAQEAAAARRHTLRPPTPEVPATALTRALLAERGATAAGQLWDAAAAAGWNVTAAYARGPYPSEKTLCPACLTWQAVTKKEAIKVHGPVTSRCQTTEPDPDSPAYQVVDSIVVRAVSPARPDGGVHRLAATWIDDGDDPGKVQYAAAGAKLWHAGDRPRDCDVVAVRTVLKAIAAGRRPKRACPVRPVPPSPRSTPSEAQMPAPAVIGAEPAVGAEPAADAPPIEVVATEVSPAAPPKPIHADGVVTLHHGDCLDVLRTLPDCSVDAVVTDPPYGLSELKAAVVTAAIAVWLAGDRDHVPDARGFMGRRWDAFVPPPAVWDECLRVLKPGGHLLAFAGSRTGDLMGMSVRLAGFEIRDTITWHYGSGFPKSLDVSKAIDKAGAVDTAAFKDDLRRLVLASGLTRSEINARCGFTMKFDVAYADDPKCWGVSLPSPEKWATIKGVLGVEAGRWDQLVTAVWRGRAGDIASENGALSGANYQRTPKGSAATDAARQWDGWGTALKPATEPIIVARKPLSGTVAATVLEYGTGALNIAATRVGGESTRRTQRGTTRAWAGGSFAGEHETGSEAGRWPSNAIWSHAEACGPDDTTPCAGGCPVAELDAQSGVLKSGANPTRRGSDKFRNAYGDFAGQVDCIPARGADSGTASRFFPTFRYQAKAPSRERPEANGVKHVTVKPLALMQWLVRLVTPPGGVVLEPFAGSGTTVEACIREGFRVVAVEREADYLPLIQARIDRSTPAAEAAS